MTQTLTLRVIQGADRGRVFHQLSVPITIGREEGNVVQLNDERISRFHVKIQEDGGRLVVTDLDSTNGTRVNGQVCNLKILRHGDTISIGRSVLLVGNQESHLGDVPVREGADEESSLVDRTRMKTHSVDEGSQEIPQLPRGLSTGQSAELRELLDHVHASMQSIIDNGILDEKAGRVLVEQQLWRQLLTVQSDIAIWIRSIEDPQTSQS
jgi:pSer/pThr/pTyr-binding forkhead associated (FHA) protein